MGSVLSSMKPFPRSGTKKYPRGVMRRLADQKFTASTWGPAYRLAVAVFNDEQRDHHVMKWDREKRKHVTLRTIYKHPAQ